MRKLPIFLILLVPLESVKTTLLENVSTGVLEEIKNTI